MNISKYIKGFIIYTSTNLISDTSVSLDDCLKNLSFYSILILSDYNQHGDQFLKLESLLIYGNTFNNSILSLLFYIDNFDK